MIFSAVCLVPFLFSATLSAAPFDTDDASTAAAEVRPRDLPNAGPIPTSDCKDKETYLQCTTNNKACLVPIPQAVGMCSWCEACCEGPNPDCPTALGPSKSQTPETEEALKIIEAVVG